MTTATIQHPKGPLIVRLCNWVGEAVLSLPTLTLLEAQGYELHLIGKSWSRNLFEGHGWASYTRPSNRKQAINQLISLRRQLDKGAPGFAKRPNIVLFTNSFSSALEARVAGLKPIGFSKEGRRLLLGHSVPYQHGLHAADNYWRIGNHFIGQTLLRPQALGLTPSANHQKEANRHMVGHAMTPGFVILCPFSGPADTIGKKLWPEFPALARTLLNQGKRVVICPGPGEEDIALRQYAGTTILTGINLGTYAALCQQAACVVSNDTGPGHLAAAAGGRIISVLGPDGAPMWHVQGQYVTVLKPTQGWPSLQSVLTEIEKQFQQ